MSRATLAALLTLLIASPASTRAQEPAPEGAAPATPAAPPDPSPSQAAPAPPATREPPARAAGEPVRLELKSGQVVTGRVVSRDDTAVTIETADGVRTTVPQRAIAREETGSTLRAPAYGEDPSRTRYLYSPSGFMLRQGHWTFSQTELLVSSVSYGATDWLTLNLGGAVPFWFVSDGFNLIGGAKVGRSFGEFVHLSATAQALTIPSLTTSAAVGLLFGTATVGTPTLNLGVSAGAPFATSKDRTEVGDYAISVSGYWRISRGLGLVTENWFFVNAQDAKPLNTLGLRFIGDRLAVDAAFLFISGLAIPIPWLDFTYHFGE